MPSKCMYADNSLISNTINSSFVSKFLITLNGFVRCEFSKILPLRKCYYYYYSGDFAILLNAGMSWKKAAVFNLISALTAIVGFYVGAAISTNPEVRTWIFTLTAGMFLYIGLADLVRTACFYSRLFIRIHAMWQCLS